MEELSGEEISGEGYARGGTGGFSGFVQFTLTANGQRVKGTVSGAMRVCLYPCCRTCLQNEARSVMEVTAPPMDDSIISVPVQKCRWCGSVVQDFKWAVWYEGDPLPPFATA